MGKRMTVSLAIVGVLCAAEALAGELIVGNVRGRPNGEVSVPVVYSQGTGPPAAAVASDIRFDSKHLRQLRCSPGVAASRGQKTVKCAEPRRGVLRLAVYGLNLDPIPDGEVATVTFRVSPRARSRVYQLAHTPTAATADGKDFSLTHHNGAIRVRR